MSKPIAPAQGIAFAFPDVCLTPAAPSPVPIPYPNVAQLGDASPVADDVVVGPDKLKVLVRTPSQAEISTSSGDEAGTNKGVRSGSTKGACKFTQSSETVVWGPNEYGIVRFMDQTEQNRNGPLTNAQGVVLGTFPTVLVGD